MPYAAPTRRSRATINGGIRPAANHRRIGPIFSTAALLGILSVMPLVLRPSQPQIYYLALLLGGLTLLPLMVRIGAGTLDLFEPVIPISLLITLAYSLRAMYVAYVPGSVAFGRLPYDDRIASALGLTIAAYVALLSGYYVLAGPIQVRPLAARWFTGRRWAPRAELGKVVVLLGIGTYATRIATATDFGIVTGSTTVIGLALGFVQLTGCVLALHIAAGDKRLWLKVAVLGIALPLAVLQSLAFGGKVHILGFVYVLVAARHYVSRRLDLRMALAIGAVAVLAVFPTINIFRDADVRPDTSLLDRVTDMRNQLRQMTGQEYIQFASENVLTRSNGVDALALSMKYDVSKELGNPTAYAYIPIYAFIPRVIWPDKPVLDQGVRFGRLLLVGGLEAANSLTSFGMYHIGDLYVSFGMMGLLVGMCAMGFMFRVVYKFLDPLHTPDLGIKFLYILVLWAMVSGFETDVPTVYANLLKFLLVWIAIKMWLEPSPSTALLHRLAVRPHPSPVPPGLSR
jgi:hypothetical protein